VQIFERHATQRISKTHDADKQPPLMQASQPAACGASHPIEPRWRCARGFVRQQGIAADPRIPCANDRRIAADRVRLFAISSCQ
jgi:hypothetical protein